jgi:hypothetical protein
MSSLSVFIYIYAIADFLLPGMSTSFGSTDPGCPLDM